MKAGSWQAQLETGDQASQDIETLLEWIRG